MIISVLCPDQVRENRADGHPVRPIQKGES